MVVYRITMVDYSLRPCLLEAVKKVNEVIGGALDFRFYNTLEVNEGKVDLQKFVDDLRSSHIVLLTVMGGDHVSKLVCETLRDLKNNVIVLVGGSPEINSLTRLGSFSLGRFMSLRNMSLMKRFFKGRKLDYGAILKMRDRFERLGKILPFGVFKDARNYCLLLRYREHPTFQSYYAMLLLLLKEYCGVKVDVAIPEPVAMPSMYIKKFETNEIFIDVQQYLQSYNFKDRPLIGLLSYSGYYYDQFYPAVELIVRKLEEKGLGVIPVFSSDLRYYLAIEKFMFLNGKPIIDLLIDLLWFRFAGGPIGGDHSKTKEVLRKLNVPVLHGVYLFTKTYDEWLKSKHGLPPVEVVTTVILPELDGRIEPIVTHAIRRKVVGDVKLDEYVAIDDRVEKLVKRAIRWVNLRRKENNQKRVAIVIYNYPPGEENLGKASYLNVFESLSRLIKALKDRGYNVTMTPSGEEIRNIFISKGIINSGNWVQPKLGEVPHVPLKKYNEWLKELPGSAIHQVVDEWGPPPGNIMAYGDLIMVPGITLGNVFIGLQPSRGCHEDLTKVYHDKSLPPHHQYIAFYKWIREEFKADVIIHLGTHGTLEFLPGKEVGLTSECFPDMLIADLPNVYVYHALNNSESSIAKRRSYALIINHASPPLMDSGLYGDFQEIEKLLSEYFDRLQYSEEEAAEVAKRILEKARKYELGESVEEIYDKLWEFKRSKVPRGLHVLGDKPSFDDIIAYLACVSRYDRGEISSLHRLIVESQGLNYLEVLEKPHMVSPDGRTYGKILSEVEEEVKNIIKNYLLNQSIPKISGVSEEKIVKSLEFLKQVYEKVMASDEIEAILNALEGKFIEPGPGGDFVRNPDVYPTGRNMYQLDPTNLPTEIAAERGKKIAEEYLKRFYQKNGRYPKAVGVVLWAFETMKTGGETLAAIFHLLGVKPVWRGLYIRELEVIPLSELGRPRIDVVVTICGIFRDTFYNLVELLDRAVRIVANLDEPEDMNYVKANVNKAKETYGESAYFRIFGPPEGQYATSLTTLIETSRWKSEIDLVNAYVESMKFAYGERERSVELKDLLNFLSSNIELVTQVRDAIDYEITDLDHYYEFLGGLAKTVEDRSGRRPVVLVADSTREVVKVEDVSEAIKRGIVTRTMNPKWLDAMLEHGYNGATKIADRVEYMLGLAATLRGIEDWMWEGVANNVVFDKERSQRVKKVNIFAYRKVVKSLLEAAKRGYWRADAETIKRLEREYLETEEILEEETC
ncbi:MAG: magnesium chelatase subunit H [Candidatus Nezhaarchaeales archaeon]